MKPKLALRITSWLMIFHAIGHSIGLSGWKKTSDPVREQVIVQMTRHKFPFMGASRSMAEYYEGFGYAATISMVMIAILFWILGEGSEAERMLTKKIIITFSIGLLAWGVDELIFFFPFAAVNTLLAFFTSLYALYLSFRQKQNR